MIADASDIMSAEPTPSQVVDIETGHTVRPLPTGGKPIGWYDEKTVALLVDGSTDNPVVQLTDITSGVVVRTVPLAGLSHLIGVQIASTTGLPQRAATHSF